MTLYTSSRTSIRQKVRLEAWGNCFDLKIELMIENTDAYIVRVSHELKPPTQANLISCSGRSRVQGAEQLLPSYDVCLELA